jgi:hypothetical protein
MRTKTKTSAPVCAFCGKSDVQFAIFNPRFAPFGTACTGCEETIPAHITSVAQWTKAEQERATGAAVDYVLRKSEFETELAKLLAGIKSAAESQFAYNEKTNLPAGIVAAGESVHCAILCGVASGWNTWQGWDCEQAITVAHDILEDANCHTEAARLRAVDYTPRLLAVLRDWLAADKASRQANLNGNNSAIVAACAAESAARSAAAALAKELGAL